MTTYYKCGICGDTGTAYDIGEQGDWLYATVPGSKSGETMIRCPKHITEYAIRKAGGRIERGQGIVNHYHYDLATAR